MQNPHFTDPDYENFPHQSSSVEQNLPILGTLEDTKSNIRNRLAQPLSKRFRPTPYSFSSCVKPIQSSRSDTSKLLILSHFLSNFLKTIPSI